MKIIILILLLLPIIMFGEILNLSPSGKIRAFLPTSLNVNELISSYAKLRNKMVMVPSEVIEKQLFINCGLSSEVSILEFEPIYDALLEQVALTTIDNGDYEKVVVRRDVRYHSTTIFEETNIPMTDRIVLVAHKLKYDISEIVRQQLAPFLSRYGRVISVRTPHYIIFQDLGSKIGQFVELAKQMDTKETYEKYQKLLERENQREQESVPVEKKEQQTTTNDDANVKQG